MLPRFSRSYTAHTYTENTASYRYNLSEHNINFFQIFDSLVPNDLELKVLESRTF